MVKAADTGMNISECQEYKGRREVSKPKRLMLKEQVAEIIELVCRSAREYESFRTQGKEFKSRKKQLVVQILNLFKAEVDKLTVIDDEEQLGCSLLSKYPFEEVADVIQEASEHQLRADRDKLLDLMGE